MLTVDYLLEILPELEEFNDPNRIAAQVLSGDGYDAIRAMLENLRTAEFPCAILEDRSLGNISVDSGPLDSYSMSIWVMLNDRDISVSAQYVAAFALGLKILKLLIRDKGNRNEVEGLDMSGITYGKRTGPDCYGYEFILTLREDIDLSI